MANLNGQNVCPINHVTARDAKIFQRLRGTAAPGMRAWREKFRSCEADHPRSPRFSLYRKRKLKTLREWVKSRRRRIGETFFLADGNDVEKATNASELCRANSCRSLEAI